MTGQLVKSPSSSSQSAGPCLSQAAAATVGGRRRFPELDLLRLLAAGAVMLYHYTYRGNLNGSQPPLSSLSFPFLGQFFRYGYLGVDVFFIISGFVILQTASNRSATEFAIARAVRLYPAYWICVTLTAFCLLVAPLSLPRVTLGQYGANLTLLQSFFKIKNIDGVYWTLAVEIQFYFLILLILAAKQIRRIGWFLVAWLILTVLFFQREPGGPLGRLLVLGWSSYFIAGAFFYLIYRDGPSAGKIVSVAACYCVSVGYAVLNTPAIVEYTALNRGVIIGILTLAYAYFLWMALRARSTSPAADFRRLGLLTYPLYLVHENIGYIFFNRLAPFVNKYVLLVAVMLAMLGLAYVIQRALEDRLAAPFRNGLFRVKGLLQKPFAVRASGAPAGG